MSAANAFDIFAARLMERLSAGPITTRALLVYTQMVFVLFSVLHTWPVHRSQKWSAFGPLSAVTASFVYHALYSFEGDIRLAVATMLTVVYAAVLFSTAFRVVPDNSHATSDDKMAKSD